MERGNCNFLTVELSFLLFSLSFLLFSFSPLSVRKETEVAQWCLTLIDPMDGSLPGSSVHGIFRATVLEWGAIAFSTAEHTGR